MGGGGCEEGVRKGGEQTGAGEKGRVEEVEDEGGGHSRGGIPGTTSTAFRLMVRQPSCLKARRIIG